MSEQEGQSVPQSTEAPQEQQAEQSNDVEATSSAEVEQVDAAQAVLDDPKASKSEKKAAEKQLKKFAIKVDGQEYEETLDLSDEEQIKKHLQLSKAAQKRMQETAEYKKQVAQFFDVLKNDPIKVLSDPALGIDVKKMAELVMNNEIEELKKTPEQREKERLQRELEDLKTKYQKDEEERKAAEFTRLQEQAAVQLDNDITSALESGGLPKTPRTVKYMAEALKMALENNLDLGAKDVLPLVKKQTMSDFRELIGALPEDELENFIGKDVINKMRKRNIQKVKTVGEQPQSIKTTGNEPKVPKEEKKIPFREFFKPY